jgi:hypothetical protein
MRASTHIASSKKPRDPNSTMSSVRNTPPTLLPNAPPLPPLNANTYAAGTALSATLNLSGGPNGAHHFIIVASLAHIVVVAMHINGHINSNKYIFF